MDLHLKDKVVLVTGGARGLGKAICTLLAAEGACPIVNYSSSETAALELVHDLKSQFHVDALAVRANVACENEVLHLFNVVEKERGPIAALVNNAAYCANPYCVDLELPEFQKCVEVNLQGMFLTCREFCRRTLAVFEQSDRTQTTTIAGKPFLGNIVNISSQAALRGSQSGKTAYDMTKAGICGFTRSLALEMASHGIVVNAVLPGLMYTDIIAARIDADPEKFNKRSPLGRIGRVEEIGRVAVWLCSDLASYMTGASVDVSGGLALH